MYQPPTVWGRSALLHMLHAVPSPLETSSNCNRSAVTAPTVTLVSLVLSQPSKSLRYGVEVIQDLHIKLPAVESQRRTSAVHFSVYLASAGDKAGENSRHAALSSNVFQYMQGRFHAHAASLPSCILNEKYQSFALPVLILYEYTWPVP